MSEALDHNMDDDSPTSTPVHPVPPLVTLKRTFFGDTDDELSDLSDSEEEKDAPNRGGEEQDDGAEGDTEEDSGDDSKPARKKAKMDKKGKSKSKAKGQTKGRGAKGKANKKGKGKDKVKTKKKKTKPKKQPMVDPTDGRLIARKPEWSDIPDWKGKEGSPLMDLPAEVLDKIFCVRQELEPRDYVALAGTCRYFRHYLDDNFFHHLWYLRVARQYDERWIVEYHPASIVNGRFVQGDEKSRKPNRPEHPSGYHPFTRPCPTSYVSPSAISNVGSHGQMLHYFPKGERSSWSKEQYTVYKEEKRAYFLEGLKKTLKTIADEAKDMKEKREFDGSAASLPMIKAGRTNRTCLAVIPGCLHGEKAVEKDEFGLPLEEGDSEDTDQEASRHPREKAAASTGPAGPLAKSRKDAGIDTSPMATVEKLDLDTRPRFRNAIKTATKKQTWVVPDTDESDDEIVITAKTTHKPQYDTRGNKVIVDFWPSKYRNWVADSVNSERINLTTALKTFKVTKAELITLKHCWDVKTNPMSTKTPQQMFLKTAVQCLAYRAHGGVEGHEHHIKRQSEISAERKRKSAAKIALAKENGTYVPREWRVPRYNHYEYNLRKYILGCSLMKGKHHCCCEYCDDFVRWGDCGVESCEGYDCSDMAHRLSRDVCKGCAMCDGQKCADCGYEQRDPYRKEDSKTGGGSKIKAEI